MTTLEDFEKMLIKHDYTYEYSDDHRAWSAGNEEAKRILKAFADLKSQGLGDEANAIYSRISAGWHHV
jgi:hypothetical protein